MTRNAQDIIDDMRKIVKPRIAKMLLGVNFEGCGKEDKAEFETEFEMILTLAEMELEQEAILDKIRAEIENLPIAFMRAGEIQKGALKIIDKYKAESKEV